MSGSAIAIGFCISLLYGLIMNFISSSKKKQKFELHPDIEFDQVFEWVVNDNGELGIRIGNRAAFLYKGYFLEYRNGHDDNTPIKVRAVYKREFGEVCHPDDWWDRKTGHMTQWAKDFESSDCPENTWIELPILKSIKK